MRHVAGWGRGEAQVWHLATGRVVCEVIVECLVCIYRNQITYLHVAILYIELMRMADHL